MTLLREEQFIRQIEANLSMLAALFGGQGASRALVQVAYGSSPITTGPRMYRLFERYGVTTLEGLRAIDAALPLRRIIKPNVRAGESFADRLRRRIPQPSLVISPAGFTADGWGQGHYMTFWECVIVDYVNVLVFTRGWQYSNGCAEEFLIGLRNGIPLRSAVSLSPLTPKDGAELIRAAILDLERRGFDPSRLVDLYRSIVLHRTRPAL